MTAEQNVTAVTAVPASFWGWFGPAMDYMVDATQRNVLFWDVMRQRGNQYRDHLARQYRTFSNTRSSWYLMAARLIARSIMLLCGLFRQRMLRSTPRVDPSWSLTHVPGMAPASAVSRLTAKSASPSKPDILVTS